MSFYTCPKIDLNTERSEYSVLKTRNISIVKLWCKFGLRGNRESEVFAKEPSFSTYSHPRIRANNNILVFKKTL